MRRCRHLRVVPAERKREPGPIRRVLYDREDGRERPLARGHGVWVPATESPSRLRDGLPLAGTTGEPGTARDRISRRKFLAALAGTAAAWPLAALAQQTGRMRRLGVLMYSAESDPRAKAQFTALVQALRSLGWIDGQTLRMDVRWSAGDA